MTLFERVHLPSFAGATEWLNSEPLGPAELEGRVVLVDFWTWRCINWLRQERYVRAWSKVYRDDGLIVVGVHTPEFSFEHDIDGVRQATTDRAIDYPVAVDNDYGIWNAFTNGAWPALYFIDRDRRIRDSHFGEGRYERCERLIRSCSASSASPSPSRVPATRRRPSGRTCARPRPTSATGATRTSRHPATPRVRRAPQLRHPRALARQQLGPRRQVADRRRERRARAGWRQRRVHAGSGEP